MKNPHSIDALVLSRADFPTQPTNLTQDTRIAERVEFMESSLRGRIVDSHEAIHESKVIFGLPRFGVAESRNDEIF